MEGSESEAIFDSLNLNPQLFLNEILNRVDDLVDGALQCFHQEAATGLKIEGTNREDDLKKGVEYLQNMIYSALDRPLSMWEKYCLRHCFVVPQGFTLPVNNESTGEVAMDVDATDDTELDLQLNSLREKLVLVGKESAELNRELRMLERQSLLSNQRSRSLDEAVQLCEQYFDWDMFEELKKASSELRTKMEKLKTKRLEQTDCLKMNRMHTSNGSLFGVNCGNGLANTTLEELQQLMNDI
ncbi:2-aminoethanethiol dioxygenase-like [Heracleum sosnowskyi]|uniref:2-aminoethanethiol dioxygenase-like n=1 Tax=Heracleum sosnowskyi TaxID=360622 RepID=A0AAD8ILC1_9APIA|nr:2-aminoethanethiol dioxygenase-like [Heracleum sosnowskyi]